MLLIEQQFHNNFLNLITCLCKNMISLEQTRTCHPASRRGFCHRNSWKAELVWERSRHFFSPGKTLCVRPLWWSPSSSSLSAPSASSLQVSSFPSSSSSSYIKEMPWYGPQVRMKPRISTPVTCACVNQSMTTHFWVFNHNIFPQNRISFNNIFPSTLGRPSKTTWRIFFR